MLLLIVNSSGELSDLSGERGDGIEALLLDLLDMSVVLLISSDTLLLSGSLDIPGSVEVLKEVVEDSNDGSDHALVSLDWSSLNHLLDEHQDGVEVGRGTSL